RASSRSSASGPEWRRTSCCSSTTAPSTSPRRRRWASMSTGSTIRRRSRRRCGPEGCCERHGAPLGSRRSRFSPSPESASAMADDSSNIDTLSSTAQGKLKSLIERIERLEEDKASVAGDLKEVYAEAKGEGFDSKIIRKVIRLRKQDTAKRQEEEALIDLYIAAIGGL